MTVVRLDMEAEALRAAFPDWEGCVVQVNYPGNFKVEGILTRDIRWVWWVDKGNGTSHQIEPDRIETLVIGQRVRVDEERARARIR